MNFAAQKWQSIGLFAHIATSHSGYVSATQQPELIDGQRTVMEKNDAEEIAESQAPVRRTFFANTFSDRLLVGLAWLSITVYLLPRGVYMVL
ncbi:hypothetical protein BpHYR1_005793 [Brachionus plicatilis]|uniref:Uncharacterized protein n=1 Tax=Brachionus plicatilis TaxID=10195 RepID=A0A3M7QER6_BRAPC|nr:hypothetical protein BpHYR1_005793 [Brachionus plicatilis]